MVHVLEALGFWKLACRQPSQRKPTEWGK